MNLMYKDSFLVKKDAFSTICTEIFFKKKKR